jgi:hypothetical protein
VANDGSGSASLSTAATTTVSLTPVNDAPSLTSVVGVTSYTENAAPITVSPSITVSDPDNINLANATVSISNTFAGDGDVLSANTAGTSIMASSSASNNTSTLATTTVSVTAVNDPPTLGGFPRSRYSLAARH